MLPRVSRSTYGVKGNAYYGSVASVMSCLNRKLSSITAFSAIVCFSATLMLLTTVSLTLGLDWTSLMVWPWRLGGPSPSLDSVALLEEGHRILRMASDLGLRDDEVRRQVLGLPGRVVVSMSTFSGRVERVNDTLQSLLSQSLLPTKIYLAVPTEVKRIDTESSPIPMWIRDMERDSHGRVQVLDTEDYGPSTKLLAALNVETDPNTIMITLDDDTVYHADTVLMLSLSIIQKQLDHKYSICFKCETWSPLFGALSVNSEGPCKGWHSAFAGTAYYRDFFDASVFDYSTAPPGCKLHDDVWLSGKLWQAHITPYQIRPGFDSVLGHRSWDRLSIHTVKNGERDYRDPCIRYFHGFA